MTTHTTYRVYAGADSVVHEDDFDEYDNALPYYDDYSTHELPDALVDHLADHNADLQKRNDELELALKDIRLAATVNPANPAGHFSHLCKIQKLAALAAEE